MSVPELYGLVLTGGLSRRMGHDKALLPDGDQTRLEVCYAALSAVCAAVWVSARPEQPRGTYPVIHDQFGHIGPLDGILSAMRTFPAPAWLVLACDMPGVDESVLRGLVSHRDPSQPATAFRNPDDGRPEPLCAIYEPTIRADLLAALDQGITSPRAIITAADALLIDPPQPEVLQNVNR